MRRALPSLVAGLALALVTATAAAQTPPAPQPAGPTADDFFKDDAVQEVRLTLNARDWQELKDTYMENRYYPCYFTWNGITVRNVGIRSRGTGSRSGTKPGLRVDFDRYTDKQRFLDLKSVVFRNQTQDASNLHERVSMLLFNKMGIPAPREAHMRLYVNNEYAGLYTIVENVDKVFLKRNFNENDGFLYEYDYDATDEPYRFEYRGSDPKLYSPKPFKPATHEKDPNPAPLEAMIKVINEASKDAFPGQIAPYLDMHKLMTHLAVENFIAEIDGIVGDWAMNNFYFYRFENRDFSTFIPWDKSETFKRTADHSIWYNLDVPSWLRNRLVERAMEHPDLVDVYLDALLRCAEIASTPEPATSNGGGGQGVNGTPQPKQPGWLEAEVQREYAQIRDAARADQYKPFTNDEFEEAVQAMLAFARDRSRYVTEQVSRFRPSR